MAPLPAGGEVCPHGGCKNHSELYLIVECHLLGQKVVQERRVWSGWAKVPKTALWLPAGIYDDLNPYPRAASPSPAARRNVRLNYDHSPLGDCHAQSTRVSRSNHRDLRSA
ncbi:MAG: hypothetical protein MN733_38085 [Nitrososphaera sp.]|nr:hypothetical protein [Nitrososphaera sp.]